jgi:hypothetical protein
MKQEKTMNQRLKTYALAQKPYNGVESGANIDDSLERHIPKTKPSTYLIYLLLSPLLACGAWLLLIWCCLNTDAN